MTGPVYADSNATTPLDPRVLAEVVRFLEAEYGNAGSRTHTFGQRAKERVNLARRQVAGLVDASADEVLFTSGATESDNLAILGLEQHAIQTGKRHIVSTAIEHKAVLEPLELLASRGFEVTLVPPTPGGWIDPALVRASVRDDTALVSVMAANNETGVIQPIAEIADLLEDHPAYFHVDAAQTFGKFNSPLRHKRVDLIAGSGHKLFAPKGVGVLIARRRRFTRVPLKPLMVGGGQERGLRPGTLPVHLIAGLGLAAEIAAKEHEGWAASARAVKDDLLHALRPLGIRLNGDAERTMPSTLNFSVPGIDSEAAILALKDVVAISNGSACTSSSYEPSHVLVAAGLDEETVAGALRISWSHLTETLPTAAIADRLGGLRATSSVDDREHGS